VELRSDSGVPLGEDVLIRAVPAPRLYAQKVSVYEGEPISLSGEQLFEQLDLWCNARGMRVRALVISASELLCPPELLKTHAFHSRVELRIESSSMQTELAQGVDAKLYATKIESPEVVEITPRVVLVGSRQTLKLKATQAVL